MMYFMKNILMLRVFKKNKYMENLYSVGIENIKIGDKVRWFYQRCELSKPINKIVYIGDILSSSNSSEGRERINRKNKKGKIIEGGYVRIDELYLD